MQAKSLTMRPAGNTKSLQTRENAPKPHLCVNVKLKPNTFLDQKEAIIHNITVPYPKEEEEDTDHTVLVVRRIPATQRISCGIETPDSAASRRLSESDPRRLSDFLNRLTLHNHYAEVCNCVIVTLQASLWLNFLWDIWTAGSCLLLCVSISAMLLRRYLLCSCVKPITAL